MKWLVVAIIISSQVWASDVKQWKRHASQPTQTQGDCIAAYLSVCGNVPLNETAIRACFLAHKFSPECMELAKGIK